MDKDKKFTEFKMLLELEGEKRISGNDLFGLLENILRYGSISRAATELGVSYRYAWGLIGNAEKALGLELINRQVGGYAGGGASLSREGSELLDEYKSFKQEVDLQLKHFISRTTPGKQIPSFEDLDSDVLERHMLLATTMEPVETGLLDVLEGAFFQTSGVLIRHIALGSGRALEIARTGRVDMVLTHAPELEEKFMHDGWGKLKFSVMENDFVLVGPASDPAGLETLEYRDGVQEAFIQIALSRVPFISRGDHSGTHLKEMQIWESAGTHPAGDWYIVSSGIVGNMGVLRLALEKKAYTLVDRATFLLSRSHQSNKMKIFIGKEEGGSLPGELENVFSLILVNPDRVPSVNYKDALLFAQWLQKKEAREIISSFGKESFGRPLFTKVSAV
ncbi:MAG: LysR family transcriptional regulator [Firmicutes bacterium]|nr:LysR family transcriptional regulator [Bacillota bacterium]